MIRLPFTVESPAATAVVTLVLALSLIGILYSYDHGHRVTRAAIDGWLSRRASMLEAEKRYPLLRRFVLGLAIIFLSMSLFDFAVASGLLKSKEMETISIERFLQEKNR